MYLAFWKGEGIFGGTFFNGLIRLWTRSLTSHVEVVFGDTHEDGRSLCFSSSTWEGAKGRKNGTRFKYIGVHNDPKWVLVEVPWSEEKVLAFCQSVEGRPYDWLGVMRFVFPILPQSPYAYFCSEVCVDAAHVAGYLLDQESAKMTPAGLRRLVG